MKKLFMYFVMALCVGQAFAGVLDPYNVIVFTPTNNKYTNIIDNKLKKCFESKGFKVYENQFITDIPQEERLRSLELSYETETMYIDKLDLRVYLENCLGREIACFSAYDRISTAIKATVKKIQQMPYNYEENAKDLPILPPISIIEDSVKKYLKDKGVYGIEGIYQTLNTSKGNWCKFAVIKQENHYVAYILETNIDRFKQGNVLAYFEPTIKKNTYSTKHIQGNKTELETFASYKEDVLSIIIDVDKESTFDALKIFPFIESENYPSGVSSGDGELTASGSGFFVSDRIIATNYHVVERANAIKIRVNNWSEIKSYQAKVLITDKKNDLALVSITDKEFGGIPSIPYKIGLETKDVGTSIFTMGYPLSLVLGNEIKTTDGIISSKTGYEEDIATYQISAPIQPGSSGGALFDKTGVLVGITNASVSGADNVGYAIKAVYLKNLIESAPVDIEMPTGRDLSGKDFTELVKILSAYMVFVEIY